MDERWLLVEEIAGRRGVGEDTVPERISAQCVRGHGLGYIWKAKEALDGWLRAQ